MLSFAFDQDHSSNEVSSQPPAEQPTSPAMSASREDTEGWRIDRLNATWGAACLIVKQLSNRYQGHWRGALSAMRDHKGTLELTWRDEQSRIMFEGVIVGAWEGQAECCVSHALAPAG